MTNAPSGHYVSTQAWFERWERPGGLPIDFDQVNFADADQVRQYMLPRSGRNTPTGTLELPGWLEWAKRFYELVDIDLDRPAPPRPRSIFDVCCGSGLVVYEAALRGYPVGGIDFSAAQIELCRRAMRGGDFLLGKAHELDGGRQYDIVTCVGGVMYWEGGYPYAMLVFSRMFEKLVPGGHFVLDEVPNGRLEAAALADRYDKAGGRKAYYEGRASGAEHFYPDPDQLGEMLEQIGLTDISIRPMLVAPGDYGTNSQFRLLVVARKPR